MLKLVTDIAFVSGSQFTGRQNNTALTFFPFIDPLKYGECISELLGDTLISSKSAEVIFAIAKFRCTMS